MKKGGKAPNPTGKGGFVKGHKRSGGRKPGEPSKALMLRDAVIEAAERVGRDGKGTEGLVGYLIMLATRERKTFGSLLGRVIPIQVVGPNNGPLRMILETMDQIQAERSYQETMKSESEIIDADYHLIADQRSDEQRSEEVKAVIKGMNGSGHADDDVAP